MKKFAIISTIILLICAGAFGFSLYHYIDVTADKSTPDETAATQDVTNTVLETQEKKADIPSEFSDGGIFSQNYEKAYADVLDMSTEQMAGQVILGVCKTDDSAKNDHVTYSLGGYLFNADNFSGMTKDQVKAKIASYKSNTKIPMIMSVDEEGGYVTAISDLDAFPEYDFYSPRDTYAAGGMDALTKMETDKATMLSSIGINLNLAPVVDLCDDATQAMYSRSLDKNGKIVAQYASNTTEISQSKGVSVALKHFPGSGAAVDLGQGVLTDSKALTDLRTNDFSPFKSGIDKGAHFVMVSNVLISDIDSSHIASLSPDVHKILRDDMKFTGLSISDNLNSADYSAYADGKDVYVQALLSGNDMILVKDYENAYKNIVSAVNSKELDTTVLQKACMRVLAYKYTAGIIK